MQSEELKALKQTVQGFNEENQSLKNLVKVLEADGDKIEDLEMRLEQTQEAYDKEKDLNKQLLNAANNAHPDDDEDDDSSDNEGDDTGDEGDDQRPANAGPKRSGVSNTEQIFRQKYEEEQITTRKLQDEIRQLRGAISQLQ